MIVHVREEEKVLYRTGNITTTFNDTNNAPLSNAHIQEAIVKVMMKDEEE